MKGKVTRCEKVVCWAATEARLVSIRYTETGERASGMPRILYRGSERGEVELMELVGVGSTGVGFRGNLIPRRARWRRMGKGGGKERRRGEALMSIG